MGSGRASAVAAMSPTDAACRRMMAKVTAKLSRTVLQEKAKCIRKQMQGKAGYDSIDCFDLLSAAHPGNAKVVRRALMLAKMGERCMGRGATPNPQELGYVFCPDAVPDHASCPAVTTRSWVDQDPMDGGVLDEGLNECFDCVAEAIMGELVELTHAYTDSLPATPSRDAIKCQGAIAKATERYLISIMNEQNKCQYLEDLAAAGTDCSVIDEPGAGADLKGRIYRKYIRALSLIGSKCPPIVLAELDSCGKDTTTEQTCVVDAVRVRAAEIFDTLYARSSADGVFVSISKGSPAGDGSFGDPIDTIEGGISAALGRGLPNVFIDKGTYSENISLAGSNLNLIGGHNSDDYWRQDASTTTLVSAQPTGLVVDGASSVTMEDLTIIAGAAQGIGGSSYGARVIDSTNVSFQNCTIQAQNGNNGQAATVAGADGANGGNGGHGSPGDCDMNNGGAGGAGGASPCSPGGSGGSGVYNANGLQGGHGGGYGGLGGAAGNPGSNGGDGQPGAAGVNGTHGVGGSGGTFNVSGEWSGQAGTSGTAGTNGAGGGGGGGGGGQQGLLLPCPGTGNGGGGGGGGGCAGGAGNPGTAAGASFGIVASGSTLQLEDTSIVTGNGGAGGAATRGGFGGDGGQAGLGDHSEGNDTGCGLVGCDNEIGEGGNGAAGTDGGDGGAGGGGAGGPTYGIVCVNGSSAVTSSVSYSLGSAGSGGSSPQPTSAGSAGASQNVWGCP